jgi:hypothetical protein
MNNENDYTTDELIIFIIRNGSARIIMSGLLIICYARAMCEKQQLWILSNFCYAGLTFLILDWWIILLKIHVHRKVVEYFWVSTGVAIFITCKLIKPMNKKFLFNYSYYASIMVFTLCLFCTICKRF